MDTGNTISDRWQKKDKLAVGVLTYRRPETLEATLESFIRLNLPMIDRFEILIVVQCLDFETDVVLRKYGEHISQVFFYKENKGAGWGCSKTLEKLAARGTEFITFLEDDWLSTEPLIWHLDFAFHVLRTFENIGYIRLRSVRESVHTIRVNRFTREDFWYRSLFNHRKWHSFIHGEGGEVFRHFPFKPTKSDYVDSIFRTNAHFTLNPSIYRSSMIRDMLPIKKEVEALDKYHALGLDSAQLNAHCFRHIGVERAFGGKRGKWDK